MLRRAEVARRAAEREDRELLWTREEAQQWLSDRRDSYVRLIQRIEYLRKVLIDHRHQSTASSAVSSAIADAFTSYVEVQIWGSMKVEQAVERLWATLLSEKSGKQDLYGAAANRSVDTEVFDELHKTYRLCQKELVAAIRNDLKVPK